MADDKICEELSKALDKCIILENDDQCNNLTVKWYSNNCDTKDNISHPYFQNKVEKSSTLFNDGKFEQ